MSSPTDATHNANVAPTASAVDLCAGCHAAEAKQSCPTCLELKLKPTRFCSQDCFKAAWKEHNATVHKRQKEIRASTVDGTMKDWMPQSEFRC